MEGDAQNWHFPLLWEFHPVTQDCMLPITCFLSSGVIYPSYQFPRSHLSLGLCWVALTCQDLPPNLHCQTRPCPFNYFQGFLIPLLVFNSAPLQGLPMIHQEHPSYTSEAWECLQAVEETWLKIYKRTGQYMHWCCFYRQSFPNPQIITLECRKAIPT